MRRSNGSKHKKLTGIKARARQLGWCEAKTGGDDSKKKADPNDDESRSRIYGIFC